MATESSTANAEARVKETAEMYNMSAEKVREIDAMAKAAGRRPLSFLAPMLKKMRKHLPELSKSVNTLIQEGSPGHAPSNTNGSKKGTSKKSAEKKSAAKKPAEKKPAAKKTAEKKPAAKKGK